MAHEVQVSGLAGRRILITEDEYFLADDLTRLFSGLGARVIGPFGEVSDALEVSQGSAAFDLAILDINLKGEMVYPIARELRARAIPFIFTSGYDRESVPDEFQDVPLLRKPLDAAAVASALDRVWGRQ